MILIAILSEGASAPRLLAGKSAEEVFRPPILARLASAACDGDSERVSSAIRAGGDPNGLSVDGGTPLLWAVKCDNSQGVEALLKAGANPNYLVLGRFTATLAAASSSNPDVLRAILRSGGDPNVIDGQWSAFRYAVLLGSNTGHWENYYTLLNGGADIQRARSGGLTVAFDAATSHQFDKVAELLDRGYGRDLEFLAGVVQALHAQPGSNEEEWRQIVIAKLKDKGIKFPVPLLHRLAR